LKGGAERQSSDSDSRSNGAGGAKSIAAAGTGQKRHEGPRTKSGQKRSAPSSESGSARVKIIKKPRQPETIEAEIAALEKRIAELAAEMARPEVARDITRLVSVNDDYQQADARLAELIDEWERAEATSSSSRR
jgi:hypothetical protein